MYTEEAVRQYLKADIFPQIASPPYGEVETVQLSINRPVYLYHDTTSHARVVGKLFQHGSIPPGKAWIRAEREYSNLQLLREKCGMKDDKYCVVCPLGKNRELSSMLVTSYAPGKTLDKCIGGAIFGQQRQVLFDSLSQLSRFFVRLHCNGETNNRVSINLPRWYLQGVLSSLKKELLSEPEAEAIERQAAGWWGRDEVTADREITVHGDATPMNFLFHHDYVTGIDLEKMKRADRCWDLGFIAAELKHHFLLHTGDGLKAEPFIGHFLWEYSAHFGGHHFFHSVTDKLPLYMTLGLLRIARNSWLSKSYRKHLVEEAVLCLKYRPLSSIYTAR